MPEGIVQAITKSRTGKPTVMISGQEYYSSNVDTSGLAIGDKISFDSNSSVFRGTTYWYLNGYKVVIAAKDMGPGPLLSPARTAFTPPSVPPMSPTGSGQIAAPSSTGSVSYGVHDAERPCISNWGAELIKAGLIKDPADLGIWVTAIKNVLR
jgi:hypothetical protein